MKDNKLAFVQKLEERRKNLESVSSRIERLQKLIRDNEKKIQEQQISVDDEKKLNVEMKSNSEALERVSHKREELRVEERRMEAELVLLTERMDEVVGEYNVIVSNMSVLTIVGPINSELKAELRKDKILDGDQESSIGVDIQHLQQTIKTHQPEVDRRIQEKRRQYQDALDEQQTQDNTTKEALVKFAILGKELVKRDETTQQEQKAHSAKLAVRQREVDAMKEKVDTLRNPVALEEQMAGFERQCAELEALQIMHQEENVDKKQRALKAISDAFSMMEEHENYVQRKSSEVKDHWAQKKASICKIIATSIVDTE